MAWGGVVDVTWSYHRGAGGTPTGPTWMTCLWHLRLSASQIHSRACITGGITQNITCWMSSFHSECEKPTQSHLRVPIVSIRLSLLQNQVAVQSPPSQSSNQTNTVSIGSIQALKSVVACLLTAYHSWTILVNMRVLEWSFISIKKNSQHNKLGCIVPVVAVHVNKTKTKRHWANPRTCILFSLLAGTRTCSDAPGQYWYAHDIFQVMRSPMMMIACVIIALGKTMHRDRTVTLVIAFVTLMPFLFLVVVVHHRVCSDEKRKYASLSIVTGMRSCLILQYLPPLLPLFCLPFRKLLT